jgi:hypothetical protein
MDDSLCINSVSQKYRLVKYDWVAVDFDDTNVFYDLKKTTIRQLKSRCFD